MPNRRDFIFQTCSLCAAAAGLGFLATQLDSCKSPESLSAESMKPGVTKSQITISTKAFDKQKNFLVSDLSLEFPVLIVKYPEGTYAGLQMKCTHRTFTLRSTDTGLVCDNHGSQFDFNGDVTHGPASNPLKKYPATVENGRVLVKLDA